MIENDGACVWQLPSQIRRLEVAHLANLTPAPSIQINVK
jgi:hypothetical protein